MNDLMQYSQKFIMGGVREGHRTLVLQHSSTTEEKGREEGM